MGHASYCMRQRLRYAFDHVFDASVSTAEVYARTSQFMIQGVLDGFNATVFAYGQTGK
jgi:kinesin family protein 18/19